jgi:hypothetical protein
VVADALARRAQVVVAERETAAFTGDLAAFLTDSFGGLEDERYADRRRQIVAEAQHDEHVAQVLRDFTAIRRAALRGSQAARRGDLDVLPAAHQHTRRTPLPGWIERSRDSSDRRSVVQAARGRGAEILGRPAVGRGAR